jgi:hypothetical protein
MGNKADGRKKWLFFAYFCPMTRILHVHALQPTTANRRLFLQPKPLKFKKKHNTKQTLLLMLDGICSWLRGIG